MRKRIVFHFYYNKTFADSIAYKIHKKCLTKYSHIFDDAFFNIVLDDVSDKEGVKFVKNFVLDAGFNPDTTVFEISKNTEFRDSETFYDYVVNSLGSYDGMTFFGHTKGTSNFGKNYKQDENVIYWITAMYYFNLEDFSYFENTNIISYINPLINNSNFINEHKQQYNNEPKYGYYPVGTFFWIKDRLLLNYIEDNNISISNISYNNRFYAENFIGNILPFDFSVINSYCGHFGLDMCNLYEYGKINIFTLYSDTDKWNEYLCFCNDIIYSLKNKKIQVIYISTDKYKNYADNFLSTLHFLMPGYKKHIIIITDDTELLKEKATDLCDDNNISFEYHKMPGDCPYPCVNLSKFAYVKAFMSEEYDYVFYFDSDTYFVDVPDEKWSYIYSLIRDNNIVIPYAHYTIESVIDPQNTSYREIGYWTCDERTGSKLYESLGIKDIDHIWVISSFFCGNNKTMKEFVTIANEMVKNSMKGEYVDGVLEYNVPRLFDETIANRMVYDYKKNGFGPIKFATDYFMTDHIEMFENYNNILQNLFLVQKYPTETWNKNHNNFI